jgi:hypothetical protein
MGFCYLPAGAEALAAGRSQLNGHNRVLDCTLSFLSLPSENTRTNCPAFCRSRKPGTLRAICLLKSAMTFYNKRYFNRQAFDILGTSVKVHKKGVFDEIEYEIPFDSVHHKKTIQTEINNNLLVTGFFFLTFSLLFLLGTAEQLTVIFFSLGLIMVVISFINRKKTVTIPSYTGQSIILYFNKNNKQEVIDFSQRIIDASNNYLLKKYSKVDRALPIEPQIEHLQFLLNREIITEEHFETLKNQLLGRNSKSSIGFGQ